MAVFSLPASTETAQLLQSTPLPSVSDTQTAAFTVYSGTKVEFPLIIPFTGKQEARLELRLFQESGSLLRPVGQPRHLAASLFPRQGPRQLVNIEVEVPEVKSISTFVCVLNAVESDTRIPLPPAFRIRAYPPAPVLLDRLARTLQPSRENSAPAPILLFGSTENPLIQLLKACNLPPEDLGEAIPAQWDPDAIYVGESFTHDRAQPSLSQNKECLTILWKTDPESGQSFIQLIQGSNQRHLPVTHRERPLADQPEFLHLFTQNLQELLSPKD